MSNIEQHSIITYKLDSNTIFQSSDHLLNENITFVAEEIIYSFQENGVLYHRDENTRVRRLNTCQIPTIPPPLPLLDPYSSPCTTSDEEEEGVPTDDDARLKNARLKNITSSAYSPRGREYSYKPPRLLLRKQSVGGLPSPAITRQSIFSDFSDPKITTVGTFATLKE